jgi:hypothetical protein
MKYFGAGLWHLSAALAFAATLGVAERGDPTFRVRDAAFLVALVVSSCALFPVPQSAAKKGVWKFAHYPLPDWDVLLLGPASHRHWLFHSAWLPIVLAMLRLRGEPMWPRIEALDSVSLGLCVGIGSHLFWDCVGSRSCSIVVVPHWWTLRARASRLWLLGGAVASLACSVVFANVSGARQHGEFLWRKARTALKV